MTGELADVGLRHRAGSQQCHAIQPQPRGRPTQHQNWVPDHVQTRPAAPPSPSSAHEGAGGVGTITTPNRQVHDQHVPAREETDGSEDTGKTGAGGGQEGIGTHRRCHRARCRRPTPAPVPSTQARHCRRRRPAGWSVERASTARRKGTCKGATPSRPPSPQTAHSPRSDTGARQQGRLHPGLRFHAPRR